MLLRRMSSAPPPAEEGSFFDRLLSVRREERAQVALAVATFFCLLFAVFLLRPLRDEMGLRGGARNLKHLWAVTLAGTMVASVAFAALSSRFGRRTFMAWTWRSVALVWLGFLPLAHSADDSMGVHVGRAFYVVHAVSNVFLVSLFWALAADLFAAAQSKRLFGLIAVGGTLGAMAGTAVTGWVASHGLELWAIVPAALLLEAAVRLASAQAQRVDRAASAPQDRVPLGGTALDGLRLILDRPYLQGIALFTLVFGVVQTFFTLQQNHIVEAAMTDKAQRTAYFAWTENAAQTLTLLAQIFVTGRLMNRLGVGAALLVLPVIGVLGFAALYFTHSREGAALGIVTVCLIAWRGLSHATQRPAREALYVPTERVEKYKAKSFTDTFAFRGGDLAGAYAFDAFSLTTAALVGLPLAAAWGGLGALLARRQSQLVAARSERDATT
jgi:AAA family ATP:ADP antiporter